MTNLARSAARSLFVGLLWGAAMLGILAAWLWNKEPEGSHVVPIVIGLCGAAALALAGWTGFGLWGKHAGDEQQAALLARQRRTTGLALLGGGALLVVLSLVLGVGDRPGDAGFGLLLNNFAEAGGLLLFSLATLYAGYAFLSPPTDDPAVNLEPVRAAFPLIRFGLLIVTILTLGGFLLAFFKRISPDYIPEMSALLLFSMLCAAVWIWTLTTEMTPFAVRLFVLVFGGGTGLVLFFLALARTVAWHNHIFGGMTAWQGADAWRFWLCVYLQIVALVLMFGSLLVARADIRENAVLRRALFGYKTVLNGLLVLEMLIVFNVVTYAMVPYTLDWTKTRGLHALAQSSRNLLHELKEETHVYVLLPQRHPVFKDVRNLMDNISAETNKVVVDYVSPDRDPKQYEKLAELFPKILPSAQVMMPGEGGRGLLVVYGALPKEPTDKAKYAFIAEKKIYEFNPHGSKEREKGGRTFRGEVEVMKELSFLVRGQERRKVYFLQGNEELDVSSDQPFVRQSLRIGVEQLGAGKLAERLRKDNYDIAGLTFGKRPGKDKKDLVLPEETGPDKKKEIPKDAHAVVVAGAASKLSADALGALERYVDRGGHLVVLLDVTLEQEAGGGLRLSGVEDLLKKYGVEAGEEVVLSYIEQPFEDPFTVVATAPQRTENQLAKQFFNRGVTLRTVRAVRPATAPGKFRAEPLLETVPRLTPATGVKKLSALRDPFRFFRESESEPGFEEKLSAPVPVAVTVSEEEKPRIVVFGDAEFVSNVGLTASKQETGYALFSSSLEWMAERGEGLIGPRPKESSTFTLGPDVEFGRMILMPGWLMLLTVLGLGLGIWVSRRR